MTAASRRVLADCRDAWRELEEAAECGDGRVWWRRWLAALVLLRAVGHVLRNVDREESSRHQRAIDKFWGDLRNAKPEAKIFWAFIDDERNVIIKEYRTRASQSVQVQGPAIHVNIKTGAQVTEDRSRPIYTFRMSDGPFVGRTPFDVIQEAIEWWEAQLDAIDLEAQRLED